MFVELRSYAAPIFVLSAWALCLTSGCAGNSVPAWVRKMSFNKEDVDPRGNLAPYKVVESLRNDRKEAKSWPVAKQEAKAAEWAAMYRNESDPLVRTEIVRTIAMCGSPNAGTTLTAALQDSERDVRIAACDAWAAHGGPQAVPSLSSILRQDSSQDVRMAAVRALGRLKSPESVQTLGRSLDDPTQMMQDPAMQYRIVQALRESTGKDFGDNVAAWREYLQGGSPPEISTTQRMKLEYF
jgi:HEAT repeat protein